MCDFRVHSYAHGTAKGDNVLIPHSAKRFRVLFESQTRSTPFLENNLI